MERFINKEVFLKKYNVDGYIKSISNEDGLIVVQVEKEEKTFTPLSVVNGAITFIDEELQEIAVPFFSELKDYLESLENAKSEEAIKEAENRYISRIRREIGDSNVAFKCNFCNGGSSKTCIGFRGPCSPDVMEFNVNNRTWCGGPNCRCPKLLNEEMSQEEFDEKLKSTNRYDFLCYESKMLIDWVCFAGMEEKSGEPMALNKAQVGSLAVMTTRPIVNGYEAMEEDRQIFGVFLIAKHDEKSDIGGSVSAHPIYRIELTPEESKQIIFWKYYYNPNNKEKAVWGTGLHRYLSDMECCQILKDIVEVIKDVNRKSLAKELLEKFQKETGIKEISEPEGAIA